MGRQKKKIKILIVDDDECIRVCLDYVLGNKGFITETASNGKEALEKIAQGKPYIIIMDIEMPVMNGVQLYKQLRKNPDTQDIPIIFLSAKECPPQVSKYASGAPIKHIEKPYDLEYLLEQIHRLIRRRSTL
jgi:two-component system alkaline phosphatase synthesis response regulator PhoP